MIQLDHGKLKLRGGRLYAEVNGKYVEVKDDGMYADGGNLYLQVRLGGKAKSWIFRYLSKSAGRERSMGLGPLGTLNLDEARERARRCRQQVLDGIDPIEARKQVRIDQQLLQAKVVTFRQVAEEWMAKKSAPGANGNAEWTPYVAEVRRSWFKRYVFPKIGDLPIQRFDINIPHNSATAMLHDILGPIWQTIPTTAETIRQSLNGVLEWAQAKKYIVDGSAAGMDGELFKVLLPDQQMFHEVKHHRSLDYKEIGQFMAALRERQDEKKYWTNVRPGQRSHRRPHAVDLIEFLILTAVRKGQVIFAKWSEIDFDAKVWRSSQHKSRKKAKADHVIPLSTQAIAVLERMRALHEKLGIEIKPDGYIFAAANGYKGHMSKTAVNKFLHVGMKRSDISIHGFRTAFKTWAIESGYPETDSEMALAHVIGNKTRNVYANGQRLEPRRLMMQAWADFCDRTEPVAGVTSLAERRRLKEVS